MKILISCTGNIPPDTARYFAAEGIAFEAYEREFNNIRKRFPDLEIASCHLPQTHQFLNLANLDDLAQIEKEATVYKDYHCVLHAFYIPHNLPLSNKLSVVTGENLAYAVKPIEEPIDNVKKIPTATVEYLTSPLYQESYASFKENARKLPPNVILENINARIGYGGNLFEHFQDLKNSQGEPVHLCLDIAHLLFSCLAYGRNFNEELDLFLNSGRVTEIHACNTTINRDTPKNHLDDMHLPVTEHTDMILWDEIIHKALVNNVKYFTIEIGYASGLRDSYEFVKQFI